MSFFDLFQTPDINRGVEQMRQTKGAVLLDVRTREEYMQSHIPGSIHIPLDQLQAVRTQIANLAAPLFVYCLSGGRSRQAVRMLRQMGYTEVTDLGGICKYHGKTQKGE